MDNIRDSAAFAVSQLGWEEVERVAIEGYYRIYSRSGCYCGPSNRLWEKLMLCMSTTTLHRLYQLEDSQRSIVIVVTPLTAIIKDQTSQV